MTRVVTIIRRSARQGQHRSAAQGVAFANARAPRPCRPTAVTGLAVLLYFSQAITCQTAGECRRECKTPHLPWCAGGASISSLPGGRWGYTLTECAPTGGLRCVVPFDRSYPRAAP